MSSSVVRFVWLGRRSSQSVEPYAEFSVAEFRARLVREFDSSCTRNNFVQHWPIRTRVQCPIEGHRPREVRHRPQLLEVAVYVLAPKGHVRVPTGGRCQVRSLTGAAYTYIGARGRAILRRDALSGDTPERGAMNVHISVTKPVEP